VDIVEECYPESMARSQASRCLRCNVNTVFDTQVCIGCNGCVDVCPENLINLVGLSCLDDRDAHQRLTLAGIQIPFEQYTAMTPAARDQLGGVMLKDESTCVRCAMCASRCPTHAITMKRFEFHYECVTVPGVQ
jgi:ferredoxin